MSGYCEHALRIVVKDTGPGFPTQALHQAGRLPLLSRNGGAGIGLLLAFSAVERLGGCIALDNPAGGGAQVSIELPITGQAGQ